MFLACSEMYSNLQKDNDCFNARLREISHEIQDILVKTTQQREDLLGLPCASPLLRQAVESDLRGVAVPAASVPETTSSNAFNVGLPPKQIRQYTDDQLLALLEPLVEKKVNQILQLLVGKIERSRDKQEEIKSGMIALSEDYQEQRKAVQNTLASFKNQISQIQQFQIDFKCHEKRCHEELSLVNDALAALNEKTQLREQRSAHRLDELIRHHHETVRNSLTDMENHVHQWKGDLEGVVYRQVSDWRVWSDELEAHVARLQGVLSSVTETVNKHTVDLRDLMETVLEKRSEVRSCQRDVNRLEMLFQCSSSLLYTGIDHKNVAFANHRKDIQPIGRAKGSEPSSILLLQEISDTKDQINFLACRIAELERCLREPSQTHVSGDGNLNSGRISCYDVVPQRLDNAEALNGLGYPDSGTARMPSQVPFHPLPSISSVESPAEHRLKVVKRMTNDAMSRSYSQEQQSYRKATHLGIKSVPSFSRNYVQTPLAVGHTSDVFSPEKRPTHSNAVGHGGSPRNPALQNPVESVNDREGSEDLNILGGVKEQEGSSSFLPPMHQNVSLKECMLVAQNLRLAADNDIAVEANPYQSRAESAMYHQYLEEKMKGNGGTPPIHPDQYPPAPVSDSESERNNYKLSRLAID